MSGDVTTRVGMLMRAATMPGLAALSATTVSSLLGVSDSGNKVSLPVANSKNGNLFEDRFNDSLRWYLPDFMATPDLDATFAFAATQKGVDEAGNPFNTVRLTLELIRTQPADVAAFRAANPAVAIREIPLAALGASLTTTSKGPMGQDRRTAYAGTITVDEQGVASFSVDLLGPAVLVLYQNLKNSGTAEIVLNASYDVWRRVGSRFVDPRFFHRRFNTMIKESQMVRPGRVVLVGHHPPASPASLSVRQVTQARAEALATGVRAGAGGASAPKFECASTPVVWSIPLARKYAAGIYALRYMIAEAALPRPIIDINDLKNFNTRQSEFVELHALGDIRVKYPSIDRAYIGVVTRRIIVIPVRYSMLRSTHGIGAVCEALVDSASSAVARCKFQFTFVLAPDVSPIDLVRFSRDVQANVDVRDCTVGYATSLKDGTTLTLLSAFQTSCQALPGMDGGTFAVSVEISDASDESPAVASANLLIRQLISEQITLMATFRLKLDDDYVHPVEANAFLNFRQTAGIDDLTFSVDPKASAVVFTNTSNFDLIVSRYALCTQGGITVVDIDQQVASGSTLSISLLAPAEDVIAIADSELAISGPISRDDVGKYMVIETQDVQNTQFSLGVNASSIDFESRNIDHINVEILFSGTGSPSVPSFALVKLKRVDSATIVVPLQSAIASLHATVQFTVTHSDKRAMIKLSLEHEFIDQPILLLLDQHLQ